MIFITKLIELTFKNKEKGGGVYCIYLNMQYNKAMYPLGGGNQNKSS